MFHIDEIGDAVDEDARLSGACAGEDQDRSVRAGAGLLLVLVQVFENFLFVHKRNTFYS